jgi:hypothetical protein
VEKHFDKKSIYPKQDLHVKKYKDITIGLKVIKKIKIHGKYLKKVKIKKFILANPWLYIFSLFVN